MDGAPYGAPSINMFDLVYLYITDPNRGYQKLLRARQSGFQVIRFFASGTYNEGSWLFPAVEMWESVSSRASFHAAYDRLVSDADAIGLKLIPSLVTGYSDPEEIYQATGSACSESRISLPFLPGSQNRSTMKSYALNLVTRYKNSKTVLFWEIGNEINLHAKYRNPSMLCVTAEQIQSYVGEMASAIKQIDQNHLVASGTIQEPEDMTLQNLTGSFNDAGDYFQFYLSAPNVDIATVHAYAQYGYSNASSPVSAAGFLSYFKEISDASSKPLWLGEFGVPAGTAWAGNNFHNDPMSYLLAGQQLGVDLLTAWNWESLEYSSPGVHPEMAEYSLDGGEDNDAISAIVSQPALMGRNRSGVTWTALAADFNGDGADDLLASANRGMWQVSIMAAQPGVPGQWLYNFGDNLSDPASAPTQSITGDWDGDGKQDVGLRAKDGRWFVAFSEGRDFPFTAQWVSGFGDDTLDVVGAPFKALTGDWNNDKKTDIAVKSRNGHWMIGHSDGTKFTNFSQILSGFGDEYAEPDARFEAFAGDWNGDKKTDFGLRTKDGRWFVAINQGTSFAVAQWLSNFGNELIDVGGAPFVPITGDWNGDGKTDIGLMSRDGRWYTAISNGTTFINTVLALQNFGNQNLDGGGGGIMPVTGDWNGDKKTDIGIHTFDGRWYLADSTGTGTGFANARFWH